MNIYEYEVKKLEQVEIVLMDIGIKIENRLDLFSVLCTDARCYELGIPRSSAKAVLGDSYLDSAMFAHCEKLIEFNYQLFTKERMNSLREQVENPRLVDTMERLLISEHVIGGNCELIVDKHLSTCFEAIVYVIHKYHGFEGINKFLEGIKFYN